MLNRFGAGLAMLLVGCPSLANAAIDEAGCHLQIRATPAQWRLDDVDAFSNEPTIAYYDLQLLNSGTQRCSAHLTLDTQGAPFGLGTGDGLRVPYSVLEHASGVDLTPRNGRSRTTLSGNINVEPGSEYQARLDVVVPSGFDADGIYSQTLLVEAADSQGTMIAQRAVTIVADVPSSATLGLSGDFTRSGSVADVDLGEIGPGSVKIPLMLHVRSTRGYNIRSSSQNFGKLLFTGTGWSIPYKLMIDGAQIEPVGGIYSSSAGRRRRADNLPLGFVVVGDTNVQSGRYSDVVTLEVSLD